MLGGFTVIANGQRISERVRKSSKVWKLIGYLAAHRNRAVSQDELLEIFCNDDSKINPGSVLRTMVYRARSALAEGGLSCAGEIILAKHSTYSWNNSISCTADTEDLEEYTKKAAQCSDEHEKLSLLLDATELYKGDFMQGSSGDMWEMPLVRLYRNIYISAACEAVMLLIKQRRYTEAETLAVKALEYDAFSETLIILYLRTLLAQGKNALALDAYKKMEAMFYDELGVDFSDELHELYKAIQNADIRADPTLDDVVMNWLEDGTNPSAYYCDTSEFKALCQAESRLAHRTGRDAFIVNFKTKHEPDSKLAAKGGGVMKNLGDAIASCLRTSDIYTRFCPNQYMVMLRSLTYEDCKMLINRILSTLDSKYLPKIIDTQITHVTPTELFKK